MRQDQIRFVTITQMPSQAIRYLLGIELEAELMTKTRMSRFGEGRVSPKTLI